MIKIEIKNRWTGSVLFEYSKENNNVKDALVEAVKQGAYLQGADLRGAYLKGAYLRGANLQGANLQGAYLQGANLLGADLQGANLQGAYLQGANLLGANLQGANLQGAYLQGADLLGANLQGADLLGAYLRGANLLGVGKIKSAALFNGLYKYIAMPIIAENGEHWIRLGCYSRLVSDWENDFWNNNSEFPNDGNKESQYRLMAYNTCKQWLEINK